MTVCNHQTDCTLYLHLVSNLMICMWKETPEMTFMTHIVFCWERPVLFSISWVSFCCIPKLVDERPDISFHSNHCNTPQNVLKLPETFILHWILYISFIVLTVCFISQGTATALKCALKYSWDCQCFKVQTQGKQCPSIVCQAKHGSHLVSFAPKYHLLSVDVVKCCEGSWS